MSEDVAGYGALVRLVTWNVARRGGASSEALAELAPDVAVLPEWGKLPMEAPSGVSAFVEFGATGEFGVGVASWGDWTATSASLPGIEGEVIGGVEVDGPIPFRLVAVWSCLSGRPAINPVSEALAAWKDWLADQPVVVAGDFNTGGSWQELRMGPMSHFPLVAQLERLGLRSVYHAARGVDQGVDEDPTHWHNNGRGYMIDHVFAPNSWTIREVRIGGEDPWRTRSDHAPMLADVVPN